METYPLRKAEQTQLLSYIRRGLSCAIIGPSNIGKSSLLRALGSQENRLALSGMQPPAVFARLDCLMAGDSPAGLYELVLSALIDALDEGDAAPDLLNELRRIHTELRRTLEESPARSLLVEAIRQTIHHTPLRLVIGLDELDESLGRLPPWPFRTLRALRDDMPGRLVFAAAASRRLDRLFPDASLYEFREMFHSQLLLLRPLDEDDSLLCYQRLIAQPAEPALPSDAEARQALILTLAGGHPGLMKRLHHDLQGYPALPSLSVEDWSRRLISDYAVQQELQRLLDELEVEERDALMAFISRGYASLDSLRRQLLTERGLLAGSGGVNVRLFSPLFLAYLRSQRAQLQQLKPEGVFCDQESGRIFVAGREMTDDLTIQERRLIRFFFTNKGKLCTYSDIHYALYGINIQDANISSNSAIQEAVKRLRKKVEPTPAKPRFLITVSGEGYRLEDP
jgi:DNA-binding winged helix-turn-helix (wHTH) protein